MIKLIIGNKGAGKTKTLIDLVNGALDTSKGCVVCLEKGNNLRYDVKYLARLVNTEEYNITTCRTLYGFIAGILASNHDVTDIFVDSALKICGNDTEEFDKFLVALDELIKTHVINLVMTSSIDPASASETVKKYL